MKRYVFLVLGLALILGGSLALTVRMHEWRIHPPQAAPGPVADQLLATAMPADVLDLQDLLEDLREMRMEPALASIGKYQAYNLLSRAVGSTPDALVTVADALAWAREFPERTGKAAQEVMASALSVRVAAPDAVLPRAGRSGFNSNRAFTDEGGGVWTLPSADKATRLPDFYFVVEARNRLRAPLQGFTFFLVAGDAAGQRTELPPRSYIQCDNSNYARQEPVLAPGASLPMLCEFRLPPAPPFSPADFARVLHQARSGALRFEVWPKELQVELPGNHPLTGLQLRDNGVSAEHGHPPSGEVASAFVQSRAPGVNPKGSLAARTTCEQRGDCEATYRKKWSVLEGFLQPAIVVLSGMLPGALAAGLVIGLARTRSARKAAWVGLVLLSIAAFPVAANLGGSGWGPLVMILILAYVEGGFWLGVLAGWIALKNTARLKVD